MRTTHNSEREVTAHSSNPLPANNLLRSLVVLAIAISLTASFAQAQTGKEPFQATVTKTGHQLGSARLYVNLPLPPVGRILTVESIGIRLGPTGSVYGKMMRCDLESERPNLPTPGPAKFAPTEQIDVRTRVVLPVPGLLFNPPRIWGFVDTPVRIYVENTGEAERNLFRVVCDVDAIGANDPMIVTVVGYTTPK